MNFQSLVKKSQGSNFYLWVLNKATERMVPFNKPHGFKVIKFSDSEVSVELPYKRLNLNHIKGLHAASLVTLSEFTTGLMILYKLDPKKYRLIMRKLSIEYLFQGKTSATANFTLTDQELEDRIINPIKKKGSVDIDCAVNTFDKLNNQLSKAVVVWQIKSWDQVKTKV